DINKVKIGQVIYCCWCDEQGKVIDDGTITRLAENLYRWTAADPSLRWFRQNALGMTVDIEDVSERVAALALQGPTSGALLKKIAEADIANLKYFRVTRGKIAGVPVDISRTGYTGDLGYEIWVPWNDAVKVWDALADKGKQFDLHAAGMLALDVARVEAGLLLIEVDYTSQASRVPVPVYSGDKQVGKATTTSWSPVLKKMIALASVETEHAKPGTSLQIEITIEAIRLKTNVKATGLPFFNPPRKTATPV